MTGGWHPAVGGACAPMFTPGRVWAGISQTPPELLAMALTDQEDDHPGFRYRTMPHDQDDSRNAVTTPAPPPSEPVTNTENAIPVPREAMNPPPKPTADSLLIDCMNQLLAGNESLKLIRHDLLDPEGAFAARQREHRRELVAELKEAVVPRVAALEEAVTKFKQQIEDLKQDMAKQRKDYETKFAEQQQCLDAITGMLPDFEKALEDARQATPPAGT